MQSFPMAATVLATTHSVLGLFPLLPLFLLLGTCKHSLTYSIALTIVYFDDTSIISLPSTTYFYSMKQTYSFFCWGILLSQKRGQRPDRTLQPP